MQSGETTLKTPTIGFGELWAPWFFFFVGKMHFDAANGLGSAWSCRGLCGDQSRVRTSGLGRNGRKGGGITSLHFGGLHLPGQEE